MEKTWQELVDEVKALGPISSPSPQEYEDRAKAIRKLGAPLSSALAKVKRLHVSPEGKVELRLLVDLDERGARPYREGPKLDELIVNNVGLRNAKLQDVCERSASRQEEIVLTGDADVDKLPLIRPHVYPLTLRVRGKGIKIDGYQLEDMK
jgi:hypothetical protein